MKKKIILFIFLIISTLSCCFAGNPSVELPSDKEARDKVYKYYSDLGWGSSGSLNSIMEDFDGINYKFKTVFTNDSDTFYCITGYNFIYNTTRNTFELLHNGSFNPERYFFIFKYNINTLQWDFLKGDYSSVDSVKFNSLPQIKYTNGHIIKTDRGDKLPLHQMGQLQTQLQGVELMEVLMEILKITPLIIGLIVSLIGFKKSWRFLLNFLRNY